MHDGAALQGNIEDLFLKNGRNELHELVC